MSLRVLWSNENTPGGIPVDATALTIARAASSDVAGMRRMSFHHHGTPGGQRRGRVASRHRERQREVARAEHGDGSDRNEHAANVRLRLRLAIGNRAIDARVHPRALAHETREHAQLPDRACTLGRQTFARQRRLDLRRVDEIAASIDLIGDAIEERRARVGSETAVFVERAFRRLERPVDVSG